MTDNYTEFLSMPFDDALYIYIEYLKAKKAGDLIMINKLFSKHPEMFAPETLRLGQETVARIARRAKNVWLLNLSKEDGC